MKTTSENALAAPTVSVEEVNRILDVGRLLLATLSPEELERLQEKLSSSDKNRSYSVSLLFQCDSEIGNTGVS